MRDRFLVFRRILAYCATQDNRRFIKPGVMFPDTRFVPHLEGSGVRPLFLVFSEFGSIFGTKPRGYLEKRGIPLYNKAIKRSFYLEGICSTR